MEVKQMNKQLMNKQISIQLETVVVQAGGLIAADMDGEKAMMSVEKGKYYGLDAVGSRIWELIDQPVTVKEVTKALLEEYDMEENTCQRDVYIFLNKLYNEGLISIV